MSLLTTKSALIYDRFRYRLLKITALFALAEPRLLATSFCAHADNQSRLTSSTFGITSRPPLSHSMNNKATRLYSKSTEILEEKQESNAIMEAKTPASKLEELRERMKELSLDCYIIPTDDPHLSGKSIFDRPRPTLSGVC